MTVKVHERSVIIWTSERIQAVTCDIVGTSRHHAIVGVFPLGGLVCDPQELVLVCNERRRWMLGRCGARETSPRDTFIRTMIDVACLVSVQGKLHSTVHGTNTWKIRASTADIMPPRCLA